MIKNNNLIGKTINGSFLVPDYYKSFICKGGECRDSCCKEWKVTISMQQYFQLHSLNCKKKVKDLIDKSFRPLYSPSADRYAELIHLYNGDCPLHLENGNCLLHSSCGANVLPLVCRYYPRGIKSNYLYESSCSNSCELTLELLFSSLETVEFERLNLGFIMNDRNLETSTERKDNYEKVRSQCFGILNDRKLLFPERLLKIVKGLWEYQGEENLVTDNKAVVIRNDDFNYALEVMKKIKDNLQESYPRLADDLQKIESFDEQFLEIYISRFKQFAVLFPEQEIYFEKTMVNHLFYNQFPFNEDIKGFRESAISVIGIYAFLRYISVLTINNHSSTQNLVDLWSRVFTVIAHSSFEKNLVVWLKESGLSDLEKLTKLLVL